jgi:hypothetical protein
MPSVSKYSGDTGLVNAALSSIFSDAALAMTSARALPDVWIGVERESDAFCTREAS